MQDGGVIKYALRKLKQHGKLYATHDLELVVVMLSLKLKASLHSKRSQCQAEAME
jgi:hypothetical protein